MELQFKPFQLAIGAFLTKSVGSIYRIYDIREAPEPVKKNVQQRETIILGSTALISLAVQAVFKFRPIINFLKTHPIGEYATIIQNAVTALVLFAGEIFGRYMTPPLDWHGVTAKEVNQNQGYPSYFTSVYPDSQKEIPMSLQLLSQTLAVKPYESPKFSRLTHDFGTLRPGSPANLHFSGRPAAIMLGGTVVVPPSKLNIFG